MPFYIIVCRHSRTCNYVSCSFCYLNLHVFYLPTRFSTGVFRRYSYLESYSLVWIWEIQYWFHIFRLKLFLYNWCKYLINAQFVQSVSDLFNCLRYLISTKCKDVVLKHIQIDYLNPWISIVNTWYTSKHANYFQCLCLLYVYVKEQFVLMFLCFLIDIHFLCDNLLKSVQSWLIWL